MMIKIYLKDNCHGIKMILNCYELHIYVNLSTIVNTYAYDIIIMITST